MTEKFIDWHSHTIYSDGADDPKTVVRNSRLKDIQSLAITDHDTLEGYFLAKDEAKKWGIDLVPGVEVSTEIYHILGLGINPYDKDFGNFLKKVRDMQLNVCDQRMERLRESGIPITKEKLLSYFPENNQRLGKYNLFMAMMLDSDCREAAKSLGYELTRQDFSRLLGKNGLVGKVENKYFVTSREAIKAIHDAGGVAIVAHPFKQAKSPTDLDLLLAEGLDGLEVQPNYKNDNLDYQKYAKEKGIKVTYGSDYHGSSFTRPLLTRNTNNFNNRVDVGALLDRNTKCLS